jgi:uncharacterized protein YyaL (SSP411 family)
MSALHAEPRYTNRLAGETSPYLLQHAHNPVDWYPWGPEALAKAKAEDKPIFLSIGYAACHWCHVMERESFEDEATAADLRAGFVAIKVDREERPDLDQVYITAVQAMTGSGGWPMSVFLTPDGKPFYGGTYFPSESRHGLPSFRDVLAGVRRAWQEDRAAVESSGAHLVEELVRHARSEAGGGRLVPDRSQLDGAVAALEGTFDAARGGWGGAPKFPQAMTIEFLLRRSVGPDGRPGTDARALAMALRTLDAMADGGIRDQLGGGFHRYATDARWLVPHFEQMLYDNAQLARVYLHAWQLTGDARYRDVARGTLDYMARELRTRDGAFAASQDADTEGEEGGTFTWQAAEVRDAFPSEELRELFSAAYGVSDAGNWEGRTILSRVRPDAQLAIEFGLSEADVAERLAQARAVLLDRRSARPQPARDDKALAAWNGLAIGAFADAVAALFGSDDAGQREAAARSYRAIAVEAAQAILAGLRGPDGRLKRSWKDGRATGEAVLEDYTHLADGLLALYEATFDERWFVTARELMDVVLERFADPAGGFFDTADDHEALVTRPKDVQDNALPSGNAMATFVLLRLAALTGEQRYRAAAESALSQVSGLVARYPSAFGQWLVALDLALGSPLEVAIVGEPADPRTEALLQVARAGFRPRQVVALASGDVATASAVPLLRDRAMVDATPTAFACRNFACRLPVTEPQALHGQLDDGDP